MCSFVGMVATERSSMEIIFTVIRKSSTVYPGNLSYVFRVSDIRLGLPSSMLIQGIVSAQPVLASALMFLSKAAQQTPNKIGMEFRSGPLIMTYYDVLYQD